tara:strand:+ start:53409 stop:54026 length:618 start_codon:yes stop_codon:yes gene_type:complete
MTGLRAKQKAQRRDMIEAAAGDLFEAKGFDVTTIEEIADKALVSPATVYNYYGNKGELLLALIAKGEARTRRKLSEFEERVDNEDPAELFADIICSNMDDTLKYMSRELWGHAVAYVATTSDHAVAPRYLSVIADDLANALVAAMNRYIKMGVLKPVDTEHFCYIMTRIERSHFLGYIYLKAMTVEEMNLGIKKDIMLLVETLKV